VPLKVSLIREGFLRAWNEAALAINRNGAEGAPEGFYTLADAWLDFPPAGVPGVSAQTRKPAEEQVRTAFKAVVSLVISREVEPRAAAMRQSFGPTGGTARQHNSLGILYARYGMYREALAAFQEAAVRGERRAAINIGNVAFMLREYETAVAWYESALQTMPTDVAPLIGLARSYYELDIYDKADEYFRRAAALQPELAERYSYLSARLSGTVARASAAMDRLGDMLWEDE
jgi:tetratricopeptide (TPR) repeat protein